MAPDSVQPLRIQKSGSSPSPKKMGKPLAEVSPMGIRRNSPSFNQVTGKPVLSNESSPFDASPAANSPRSFWKSRENESPTRRAGVENANPSTVFKSASVRRNSLEKLQKASRVKNSNIFALENSQSQDESPSLSDNLHSFRSSGGNSNSSSLRASENSSGQSPSISPQKAHRRSGSSTNVPILHPTPVNEGDATGQALPKTISSPHNFSWRNSLQHEGVHQKETVVAASHSPSPQNSSATPRSSARILKTVSFDQAPPQINEYEMITPDPSSVASGSREGSYDSDVIDMDESFEHDESFDREDSFDESLEDVDKTPVVLPEDWRFMNPDGANTDLARTFEDPFHGEKRNASSHQEDTVQDRPDSVNSNGERRPLPPLPPSRQSSAQEGNERPSSAGTPPLKSAFSLPASISKEDVLGMRGTSLPLEERTRMLTLQEQTKELVNEQKQKDREVDHEVDEVTNGEIPVADIASPDGTAVSINPSKAMLDGPPRISRDAILRKVKSQRFLDEEYRDSSPEAEENPIEDQIDYANLDPDQPIPSREASSNYDEAQREVQIKEEPADDEDQSALFDLPDFSGDQEQYRRNSEDYDRESSVIHHEVQEVIEAPEEFDTPVEESETIEDQISFGDSYLGDNLLATPDAQNRISLPEFTSGDDGWRASFQSYMSPSPPELRHDEADGASKDSSEPAATDVHESVESMGSLKPREKFSFDMSMTEELDQGEDLKSTPADRVEASPTVPERVATVRAPGGKLKIRPSATAAELQAMNEEASTLQDDELLASVETNTMEDASQAPEGDLAEPEEQVVTRQLSRAERRRSARMSLNVNLGTLEEDTGLGLDQEFDRVIEARKGNYVTRQPTKIVVASNRSGSNEQMEIAKGDHSTDKDETQPIEGGTRKPSGPTVITEPWNGKIRRHATRRSSIVPGQPLPATGVPPLPGHPHTTLESVQESSDKPSLEQLGQGAERGRLFVKVVGVKDLDLPLSRCERTHFQLTLDNGMHCVTTAWLELGKNAPIGQEFELTVCDELDFSLTLQAKLERPSSQASQSSQGSGDNMSPSKGKQKASALSRLLTSPKKRREAERKQQEEEEAAQEALRRQQQLQAQKHREPTSWDLLHNLVGPDGSFARSIISLEDYEDKAYGRPLTTSVSAFNNWASEDAASSTRSKHGGIQRRPPYKIGTLELQILYIPKPRGVKDEDMPQSMSACVKQLKEAEITVTRQHEGFLSQQGGDCPYWRRRFFRLNGSTLTAYHEMTRQRRANINLAKASKLIDDKSSSSSSRSASKTRRKSAFADDEEGYMFVEEGFRIRFANGETIDFYADNRLEKQEWMKVLSDVVGKEAAAERVTWMSMVFAREKAKSLSGAANGAKTSAKTSQARVPNKTTAHDGSRSMPTSPMKKERPQSTLIEKPPPPIDKSPRHSEVATKTSPKKTDAPTPRQPRSGATGRRQAVRSMIF